MRIARENTFVPITSENLASADKPGKVGKVREVSQHRTFLDRPENLSNLPVATMKEITEEENNDYVVSFRNSAGKKDAW
jgi:hypothetical protein